MPGLFGLIPAPRAAGAPPALAAMLAAVRRDPTLPAGTEWLAGLSAGVGWTGSPGAIPAPVPVWNTKRDVALLFTGEHFASTGDALVPPPGLVALYEERGDGFFAELNGTFAGVLVDLRPGRERLVVFNDRYGLGRIYWHEGPDGFFFATEAKALLRVLPAARAFDPAALAEHVTCGCVLQDRTLFPGIALLPGGSAWSFRPDGRRERRRYFDRKSWEVPEPVSFAEYGRRTGEALERIIPRCFAGPAPVALSLTGGVDSRMILAGVAALPRFPCYTYGGMYRECADVRIARQLAQVCGHPYQVIPLTREFFGRFPDLARDVIVRTDGAMDVSGAVGLFVNQLGRAVAPVRMTGNYGGEILRALVQFRPHRENAAILHPDLAAAARRAAETYQAEREGPRAAFTAFKQVPWMHYARFALEQSILTIRTPFLDNELVRLSFLAPPQAWVDKSPAFDFIHRLRPALSAVPTDRGATAKLTWLPVRARRMLTEFMPRAEYVYDYGMPQWLARADRLVAPLRVERLFLGRQKYTHYRIWYRRELAGFVRDVLLDPAALARPYLNRAVVERMVRAHTRGTGNYTTMLHLLLSLELTERHLLRAP